VHNAKIVSLSMFLRIILTKLSLNVPYIKMPLFIKNDRLKPFTSLANKFLQKTHWSIDQLQNGRVVLMVNL